MTAPKTFLAAHAHSLADAFAISVPIQETKKDLKKQ